MTILELFEKRKVKQDSDGEYPYIMMYGQIDEIIQEVEALVRKETIKEILNYGISSGCVYEDEIAKYAQSKGITL